MSSQYSECRPTITCEWGGRSGSRGLFKFCQISDIISAAVQDRGIFTTED